MSDYRQIEIIVNTISKENAMTGEDADITAMQLQISVSESASVQQVTAEIKRRVLSIEEVL